MIPTPVAKPVDVAKEHEPTLALDGSLRMLGHEDLRLTGGARDEICERFGAARVPVPTDWLRVAGEREADQGDAGSDRTLIVVLDDRYPRNT